MTFHHSAHARLLAYRRTQHLAPGGREDGARALLYAARLLANAARTPSERLPVVRALKGNVKLWNVLRADASAPGGRLTDDMRRSVLSLSVFVEQTSRRAAAEVSAQPLTLLADINRTLAGGLLNTAPGICRGGDHTSGRSRR